MSQPDFVPPLGEGFVCFRNPGGATKVQQQNKQTNNITTQKTNKPGETTYIRLGNLKCTGGSEQFGTYFRSNL